ncbi:cyclic di-GMP phosphodiesterase [Chitiniphilus shinanonensis]|uniref:Cyclic di-GMP phosphodiesterase n=1 Tax=Chitiniphilus shinanonensis TaxID=553088 RepID=A0ABQ6BRX1_9NEIS|nr:HD-GYP domain-containing protein [Chitiniphilus shinanonensis]GLS04733.1 cyclic di-GMP phosphodiesterase [Chitiniphilus shinanonensis]
MIKKIPVAALRPGMYIHDLNAGWLAHPFLFSSFKVTQQAEIDRIAGCGIHELYIDTGRGLDVADAPTREAVEAQLTEEMTAVLNHQPAQIRRVDVASELSRAQQIKRQAHNAVRSIMNDVRLGKAVEVAQAEAVVETITESVLRNDGALIGLMGIKNKDDYTFLHSVSVCALMVAFAQAQGCNEETVRIAGLGALLHDTGKMMVPDAVLNKPGRYTEEEFAIMKKHPEHGWQLLSQIPDIDEIALDIVLHHHERLDGTGYPHGLAGDQIATLTQMSSIVDVYDAITADRVYHQGVAAPEGLRKLWEWSSHHFSPDLVQSFIRMVGIYPVGSLVRLESGRLAVVMQQHDSHLLTPQVKVVFSTRSNAYLPPEDLDLALGQADRIVGHEDARKWRIDTGRFLQG